MRYLQPAICVFLLYTILPSVSYSQKKKQIGINIYNEVYPTLRFHPSAGFIYEQRFTNRSGLEAGLLFNSEKMQQDVFVPGSGVYTFSISRRYATTHLSYKYYARLINFSIGPTLDYFISWKQERDTYPGNIENYTESPRLKLGYLAKVSKAFQLKHSLVIEPELRLSNFKRIDLGESASLSIGISGKYAF
jgi:hypothetical protein